MIKAIGIPITTAIRPITIIWAIGRLRTCTSCRQPAANAAASDRHRRVWN